ncbi:MAG: Maf family protein [Verrucomicrobiota bacterium]|nr:Maf family protein [Verrucomicrobiota bacterium]
MKGGSPRFILASGSPRRRELLSAAGFQFEVIAPRTPETAERALTIRELTTANATRKALAVARAQPHAVVLGADTLVALDGNVIGKPADMKEALAIVERLNGRVHRVCTSVFLCSVAGARRNSFSVISEVEFRNLRRAEICAYLEKINPLDKAGAYAAQGYGGEIIREIRGSYTNVVGLPMDETATALARFGVAPVAR